MTLIVAGIDPGKTGAMVILYPSGTVIVCRVPLQVLKGKETPAWGQWAREWAMALDFNPPDRIVREQVGSMPKQGVTSMFNFGRVLGYADGIISATTSAEFFYPTPSVWKAKFGLLNSDKNASREKARQLLPKLAGDLGRVKDDGVAEAGLLALYGRSL